MHLSNPFITRALDTDTEAKVRRGPAEMTIEDLDTNYCDDFVCTSSPAIEQTVRSLANDLTKLRYTNSLFQPDCKYEDGFRKFKGPAKYKRPFWFRDGLKKPSAVSENPE